MLIESKTPLLALQRTDMGMSSACDAHKRTTRLSPNSLG